MTRIGIMEGRLVPPYNNRIQCFPKDNWSQEFALAAQAGLECIEWIYDGHGLELNPFTSSAGLEQIKTFSQQSSVGVLSICADYFMENPLVRASVVELSERLQTLSALMRSCQVLMVNRIVLPFVDASQINTDEEFESVIEVLKKSLNVADETDVEIHLETSLAPARFAALLNRLPHPKLKVNYDSGNSASLGYHPFDEFRAYGSRVGSVHIKDRIKGGGTVALGSGNVDFPALGESLKKINYTGDFILQVARGITGEEVIWARQNHAFVVDFLSRYKIGSYGPGA